MKIHNVFYPNLLQKGSTNLLNNKVCDSLPPISIKNKEKWEVNDILDARSHWGKLQYRVKLVGWDKNKECYNVIGFDNFSKIVNDFYSHYPEKPRSRKSAASKNKRKRY